MVQDRFDEMNGNAEARHPRCSSAPQIMERPPRDFWRARVSAFATQVTHPSFKLPLSSRVTANRRLPVHGENEILRCPDAWRGCDDCRCPRREGNVVLETILGARA